MARPALVKNPKRKNYYLPGAVVDEATRKARARYGISTSELIARLLVRENRHPKGICHQRPRELTPA